MGNWLAIATASAAISKHLEAMIDSDGDAKVTMGRPDTLASSNDGAWGVNLFLYRVTPNTAFRNQDLPTRRADRRLVQKPVAAYDLHYLLSVYGRDNELALQAVLGSIVAAIHAHPVIAAATIAAAIADSNYSPEIGGSDLASQSEPIRLSPATLTIEQLSSLWSMFAQTPYRLSFAVDARLVLIEDSRERVQPALPVRSRNVYLQPMRVLAIDRVFVKLAAPQSKAEEDAEPAYASSTLVLEGQSLRGDVTRVRIGDAILIPTTITDRRIELELPTAAVEGGNVRAGVQSIQVHHELLLGSSPEPHRGPESNAVPLTLHPNISNIQFSAAPPTLSVDVTPAVDANQTVLLLLDGINGVGSHAIALGTRTGDATTLVFGLTGVAAGSYRVRVQVDGARSVLPYDKATNQFTDTPVTIP